MNRTLGTTLVIAAGMTLATLGVGAMPPDKSVEESRNPLVAATKLPVLPSVDEARGRARLLHETIRAMLQVVHHEYYREDQKLPIPARTFKKVFQELADQQKVEVHWLAVTGQAMNVSHDPQNEFERQAVNSLAAGAEEHERVEDGLYRHVGVIKLTAECLKCHVPNRTNLKDRAAGLIIAIPIKKS